MNAQQKETAAKWVLALGASALFAVSLTSPTLETPLDTTAAPEAPAPASDLDFAGNHRGMLHFIAALC